MFVFEVGRFTCRFSDKSIKKNSPPPAPSSIGNGKRPHPPCIDPRAHQVRLLASHLSLADGPEQEPVDPAHPPAPTTVDSVD